MNGKRRETGQHKPQVVFTVTVWVWELNTSAARARQAPKYRAISSQLKLWKWKGDNFLLHIFTTNFFFSCSLFVWFSVSRETVVLILLCAAACPFAAPGILFSVCSVNVSMQPVKMKGKRFRAEAQAGDQSHRAVFWHSGLLAPCPAIVLPSYFLMCP